MVQILQKYLVPGSNVRELFVLNNQLYFSATDGSSNERLWQYDGTNNPSPVAGASMTSGPVDLVVFQNKLHFFATDAGGIRFWQYDGTNPPNIVVTPSSFVGEQKYPVYNNHLILALGSTLWQYDGTNVPTEIAGTASGNHIAVFNSKLYFPKYDGTLRRELHVYDGSTVSLAFDINLTGDAGPVNLIVFHDKLFFEANDGSGTALWEYDGIHSPVKVAGFPSSGVTNFYGGGWIIFNNKLTMWGGPSNSQLWQYDGLTSPSQVSFDGSYPQYFTVYDDKLYFQAKDAMSDVELWVYDGSKAPTRVADINTSGSSSPGWMAVFHSKLYFAAIVGNPTTSLPELMVYSSTTRTLAPTPASTPVPTPTPAPPLVRTPAPTGCRYTSVVWGWASDMALSVRHWIFG